MGLHSHNEETLRSFLLGTLPAAEQEALEEKFMAEDDLFAALNAAEEDLLEEYARGELSLPEKERLERGLLLVPRNRERAQLLRTMQTAFANAQTTAEPASATPKKSSGFFQMQSWRYALAAACLVLACGLAWWLLRSRARESSLQARNPSRSHNAQPEKTQEPALNHSTPTSNQQNTNGDNPASNQNTAPSNSQTPSNNTPAPPTPRPAAQPFFATLLLSAGASRSEGSASELNLLAGAQAARIGLILETAGYTRYRAVLRNENGALVWQSGPLKASGQTVTLNIPRRYLLDGDYVIKLSGLAADDSQAAGTYTFRVKRS